MPGEGPNEAMLTISGLSRASGISVETLRNWERRYGFPEPRRRPSGHRRYLPSVVPRLRLVRQAVESGYQPSFAVGAEPAVLRDMLGEPEAPARRPSRPSSGDVDAAVRHIEALDARGLELALEAGWSRLGARYFVTSVAVPLLREIGDRWEDGRLSVSHEHFASGVMVGFLARHWRPLAAQASGPAAVLTTPSGQDHFLSIHLAAVLLALRDVRSVFLGPNTPVEDVVSALRGARAALAVIGLSPSADPEESAAWLERLAARAGVPVLTGGDERVRPIEGVVALDSFDALWDWLGADGPPGTAALRPGG